MGKKIIFLFLALLLPVLIFVFLKLFGKNEFDVPVLFEGGVMQREDCNISYSKPYVLDDSIYRVFNAGNAPLVILSFSEPSAKLTSLSKNYEQDQVRMLQVSELNLNEQDLDVIKKCYLLIEPPNTLALIDNRKRIRGHYDGTEREDVDRLEAELQIILKKY